LFVVGDPKQSIYRFRGADYDAFRRAVETIGDGDALRLTLQTNFRSVPGVVEAVNKLFSEESTSCWLAGETQPEYEPISSMREDETEGPAVEIWTVDGERTHRLDRRRRVEGQLIAMEVERLRSTGARYKDIQILFRTFASIPTYLRPLRERNIPFVVDGGKDFIKRPEIKQSLAVLRTLAQPSDETALLAFLRSPAGGVPDTELARWAAEGLRWDWRHESGDAERERCPRIVQCFALLRELNETTRHVAPDAAVRTIVERFQLLPLAAAAFEGAQRVANLNKLVAAASHLTRDGHLSLEDLVDEIEEGGLAELEADSPLSDDATDAVRITSIHKMKGLESPWVLLPDLARQRGSFPSSGLEFAVLRDRDGSVHLAAKNGSESSNAAWIRHHLEHLQHEESEETRVLYVALTRARNRLVLISSPGEKKYNKTRWYDALAGWGYLPDSVPPDEAELAGGAVRHRLLQPPAATTGKQPEPPSREPAAVAAYDEASRRLHELSVPPFRAPSAAGHEVETVAPFGAPGADREIAKATGLVIHAALESWDGEDVAGLDETAAELARAESDRLGIDSSELRANVADLLAGFRDSELGSLFGRLDIVARELPLLLRDDTACWRGSIDLVYRDGDAYVVADYKTDRVSDEAELRDRYAGQLAIYARALQSALGVAEPPRAELWLLRHGTRVAVPLSDRPAGPQPTQRADTEKRTQPEQQDLF
jgi:ATP-dependent helicase/nuclease subunit A